MTRRGKNVFRLVIMAILVAANSPLAGESQPSTPQPSDPPFAIIDGFEPLASAPARGDVLSTLRPIVRRFDFDGVQTGSNALPPNFYRFVAPSHGFPPFGSMRVVSGTGFVAEGADQPEASALQFDLAGGSMSARIGTSVIPVLPYADYIVACHVRTEGLSHAHAQLVAWLCDGSGRVIQDSRLESRGVHTAGAWQTLSLEMHGNFADAADLIFELQLIQPEQQTASRLLDGEPRLQDVFGRAWFDDVTISHLPLVTIGMSQPGNVVALGEPAEFDVQVNELSAQDLKARLRIFDIDGTMVFDHTIAAPRGREPARLSVPFTVAGWYRTVLDVTSDEYVGRRRWLDFVVVPRGDRQSPARSPFGVALNAEHDGDVTSNGTLVSHVRAGLAVVPAWRSDSTLANLSKDAPARRALIDHLLREGVNVVFSLGQVPEELAGSADHSAQTALDVLAGDARVWRPYLDDLLMHFGLPVNRWIVGSNGEFVAADNEGTTQRVRKANHTFSDLAPGTLLHLTWPAEHQPPSVVPPDAESQNAGGDLQALLPLALHVSHSVPPESIPGLLQPWFADGRRHALVNLDLLPTDSYTPRQRALDALLRGLNAWRAASPAVIIQQPWRSPGDRQQTLSPDPVFAVWRTLSANLAGRTFVSELAIDDGIHAWVARGHDADDSVLIAWCDRPASSSPEAVQVQLADHPVTAVDAFGNTSTLEPHNRLHTLNLTEMPLFVEHVSLELVMFRSGVMLDPGFVPAASKVHEHELLLRNPWDTMVAGSVRLTCDHDLQISPAVQEFTIAPRGEARLPLQIIPQRGILAGRKSIIAEITLNADRLHVLRTELDLEVGLKDIEVSATWTAVRNPQTGADDLLVRPAVTNHSLQPVNLDVDLLAEGVSHMRRTIAGLQPGQTQTRTFRIANGIALLQGKQIRLGVAQRDGVARLNKMMTIGSQGDGSAITAGDAHDGN